MSQINLFYAGQPGEGFGWGTANKYLIRDLGKLCSVKTPNMDGYCNGTWSLGKSGPIYEGTVFMPIADHDLNPLSGIRGRLNLGYTFFEYPLGPKAKENSKLYDLIFTGSTWCKERLAEIGVHNTEVLIQGVDADIFKPEPSKRSDDCIRMFSGGKFEYRKGQDIVLAAFKLLHEKYPKLRLVTCWHNLWPQLIGSMRQSPYIMTVAPDKIPEMTWNDCLRDILEMNRIPKEKVLIATPGPSEAMAFIYNQCDFGVFPNRCEGGTNLVMMEFMACGKPVVANTATGQGDVLLSLPFKEIGGVRHEQFVSICGATESQSRWYESTPAQVADAVEQGIAARSFKPQPYSRPWSEPAKQIIAAIERLS